LKRNWKRKFLTPIQTVLPNVIFIRRKEAPTRLYQKQSLSLIGVLAQSSQIPIWKQMIEKKRKSQSVPGAPNLPDIRWNSLVLTLPGRRLPEKLPPLLVGTKKLKGWSVSFRARKEQSVLLGEAGVGKTAIVQGLAQRIVRGEVPDTLKNKMIVELNVGVLVAGTTYRGDFERRMEEIVKEAKENQSVILFIDELHTLMGAGDRKHGLDGSNILKPALATGDLRLIGATTTGEYARSIEKDPAMERRFSPIYLSEIDQKTDP
jgi:ATP-dependent Clp protease ATP-binding subunit ClpC